LIAQEYRSTGPVGGPESPAIVVDGLPVAAAVVVDGAVAVVLVVAGAPAVVDPVVTVETDTVVDGAVVTVKTGTCVDAAVVTVNCDPFPSGSARTSLSEEADPPHAAPNNKEQKKATA